MPDRGDDAFAAARGAGEPGPAYWWLRFHDGVVLGSDHHLVQTRLRAAGLRPRLTRWAIDPDVRLGPLDVVLRIDPDDRVVGAATVGPSDALTVLEP